MKPPQLDVQAMAMLLGIAVPVLVAFVVKQNVPSSVKVVINLFFTAVMSVIALWANADGHITFWQVVNTVIVTLVASLAAYRGIWKPLAVQTWTAPTKGIGPSTAAPVNNA